MASREAKSPPALLPFALPEHPDELFLIAANDGQLAETFRRLLPSEEAQRAKDVIEELLVTDQESVPGCALRLFNLSRGSSVTLFKLALDAFLSHDGWQQCIAEAAAADQLFGRNARYVGTMSCLQVR